MPELVSHFLYVHPPPPSTEKTWKIPIHFFVYPLIPSEISHLLIILVVYPKSPVFFDQWWFETKRIKNNFWRQSGIFELGPRMDKSFNEVDAMFLGRACLLINPASHGP